MPITSDRVAAMATPPSNRISDAQVSFHNRISPVRRSPSVNSRTAVSPMVEGAGKSLSAGLAVSRMSDATA